MSPVDGVQLIAVDVSIGDGHDAGIASNFEAQFVLCHRHTTPFAVDSLDAYMHQIGTVGLPSDRLVGSCESDGLTNRLYPVTSHGLQLEIGQFGQSRMVTLIRRWNLIVGNGFEFAVLIGDMVSFNLVTLLGIVFWIHFLSQTFAVEQQFHLVGIGIGD